MQMISRYAGVGLANLYLIMETNNILNWKLLRNWVVGRVDNSLWNFLTNLLGSRCLVRLPQSFQFNVFLGNLLFLFFSSYTHDNCAAYILSHTSSTNYKQMWIYDVWVWVWGVMRQSSYVFYVYSVFALLSIFQVCPLQIEFSYWIRK